MTYYDKNILGNRLPEVYRGHYPFVHLLQLSKLAIIVSNPILLWLAGICKYKSCNHKIKSGKIRSKE